MRLAGNGGTGLTVTDTMVKAAKWDPADYAANSTVQHGWARELIAGLSLRGDERVLDVGCGDGKITAEMAGVLPRGSAVGTDASTEMIAFARARFPAGEYPNLKFQVMDAREIRFSGQFDLVFSNAALHWVDDHPAFLRGAAAVLKPGGRLVISCGGTGNAHDVFLALRPEMRSQRWRAFFREVPRPYHFYAPADYQKWLPKFGFKINVLGLTPRDISYAGAHGIATSLRTTWIPYVQRVPENLRDEFIAAVTQRYLVKHPPDAAGMVQVRMVRLDIDAVKT
jgi:trans-aconitate methyltransferase